MYDLDRAVNLLKKINKKSGCSAFTSQPNAIPHTIIRIHMATARLARSQPPSEPQPEEAMGTADRNAQKGIKPMALLSFEVRFFFLNQTRRPRCGSIDSVFVNRTAIRYEKCVTHLMCGHRDHQLIKS